MMRYVSVVMLCAFTAWAAVDFEEDDFEHLSASDHSAWHFGTNDYSIVVWAKFESSVGYHVLSNQGYELDSQRAHVLYYGWSANELHMATQQDANAHNNKDQAWSWTASVDTWYHIAIVRDGSTLSAYVNGVKLTPDNIGYDVQDSGYALFIANDGTAGANPMDGLLDHYCIYHIALSAENVRALYTSSPHRWDTIYDKTVVLDSSGNGNHGTVTGDIIEHDGSSFYGDFDGTEYVTIADCVEIRPQYPSLSLWFQTTDSVAIQSAYRYRAKGYGIEINTDGTVTGMISDGVDRDAITPGTFNDGLWHHAVMTYDHNYIRIYVDGILENSTGEHDSIVYSGGYAAIGRAGNYDGTYMVGQIKDVRLYNDVTVLTSNQINNLYLGIDPTNQPVATYGFIPSNRMEGLSCVMPDAVTTNASGDLVTNLVLAVDMDNTGFATDQVITNTLRDTSEFGHIVTPHNNPTMGAR